MKYIILHHFIHFLDVTFEYSPLSHLQIFGIYLTSLNQFKDFWPCYFMYSSEKCTDNFFRVRRLIGGFNNLCRNIYSGVGETVDK